MPSWDTHVAIWRGRFAIGRWLDLVKIIFVELSNKAGHVAVLEMLRQDRSRKLLTLFEDVRVNSCVKLETPGESHLDNDK